MSVRGGESNRDRCQQHVSCCSACGAYLVAVLLAVPASSSPCMPLGCLSVLVLVPATLRLLFCAVVPLPRLSPVMSLLECVVLFPSAHFSPSFVSFSSLPLFSGVRVSVSFSAVLSPPLVACSSVSVSLRLSSSAVAASVCCCVESVHESRLLSTSPALFPLALLLLLF